MMRTLAVDRDCLKRRVVEANPRTIGTPGRFRKRGPRKITKVRSFRPSRGPFASRHGRTEHCYQTCTSNVPRVRSGPYSPAQERGSLVGPLASNATRSSSGDRERVGRLLADIEFSLFSRARVHLPIFIRYGRLTNVCFNVLAASFSTKSRRDRTATSGSTDICPRGLLTRTGLLSSRS